MSVAGRRLFQVCRSASGTVCRWSTDGGIRFAARGAAELPGPAPAGGPISCPYKKWGKEAAGGCAPLTPSAASGWPAAKVGGALPRMNGRVCSIPPAAAPRAQCLCRRAPGTVPEMLSGRCDGKNAKERRPVGGAPLWLSLLFLCWVRPQPELSPQLVYPWGVAVVRGSWQGTPGGFSRGLAEVPLSALLPPTSWARKKSARPPGRVPAIYAAAGGSLKAPRRGAKKAPPGATRQIKETSQRLSSQMTSDSWRLGRSMRLRIASSGLRPS